MKKTQQANEDFSEFYTQNHDEVYKCLVKYQSQAKVKGILQVNGERDILDTPLIIDERLCAEIVSDCKGLLKLIRDVPHRFFNNNLAAICAEIGIPSSWIDIMKLTFGDDPIVMSRFDVYIDSDDTYKILEANVDSNIGGLEFAFLNKILTDDSMDPLSSYLFGDNICYVDSLEVLGGQLKALDVTSLCIVDHSNYIEGYLPSLRLVKQILEKHVTNVSICSEKDLIFRDGFLFSGQVKIDFLFKVYFDEDIFANPSDFEGIYAAYKAGSLKIFSGAHHSNLHSGYAGTNRNESEVPGACFFCKILFKSEKINYKARQEES